MRIEIMSKTDITNLVEEKTKIIFEDCYRHLNRLNERIDLLREDLKTLKMDMKPVI